MIKKDHDFVQTCIRAQEKILNKKAIGGFPSGCDARILYNVSKIPTVILGPGSLVQAHSIDEYVSLDQYLKCIEIVSEIILDWTSKKQG